MTPLQMFIIAALTLASPAIIAWVTGRQRRREKREDAEAEERRKREDWARQDEVADRLLNSQQRVEAKADEVVIAAKESVKAQEERAECIDQQLKEIDNQGKANHKIINSEKTERIQIQLSDARVKLVLLRRLNTEGKLTEEDQQNIKEIESKIVELEATLADRLAQQKRADEQAMAEAKNK